jgi:hypothetical protein
MTLLPPNIYTHDGTSFHRIPGFPEYAVSQCGKVFSIRLNRLLKECSGNHGYFVVGVVNESGLRVVTTIHRLMAVTFLGATKSDFVDHIDRNRQNNTLCNLRLATKAGNAANSKKRNGCLSLFKGVSYIKETGVWYAFIGQNGKKVHLGCFALETDAAKAYDDAARRLFGEFANTNFN